MSRTRRTSTPALLACLLLASPAAGQSVGRSVIQHDVTLAWTQSQAEGQLLPRQVAAAKDYLAAPWIARVLAEWPALPRDVRGQRRERTVLLLARAGRSDQALELAQQSATYDERLGAYQAILEVLLERGEWQTAADFARGRTDEFQNARLAGRLERLASWIQDALARCGDFDASGRLQEQLARDFGPRFLEVLSPFERRYRFALCAALYGRRPEAERAWFDLRREGLNGNRAWELSKRLALAAVRDGDGEAARSHAAAMASNQAGAADDRVRELELGLVGLDLTDGDLAGAVERARALLVRFSEPQGLLLVGLAACGAGRLDLADECSRALAGPASALIGQNLEVELARTLFQAGNVQEALARLSSRSRWERPAALAAATLLLEQGQSELAARLGSTDRGLAQAIDLLNGMLRGAKGDSDARSEALARAANGMDPTAIFPRIELLEAYDQVGANTEAARELDLLIKAFAGSQQTTPRDAQRILGLDLARQGGNGLARLLPTLGNPVQRFDLCVSAAELCVYGQAPEP